MQFRNTVLKYSFVRRIRAAEAGAGEPQPHKNVIKVL
jgi:hypothetical protein